MSIQFRSLSFYSRPEEQIQEHLHLKKFETSLSVAIDALGSRLGPHTERDLATDLYSGSTSIIIIDKFDHRISFNSLMKFVTSLSAAFGQLGSPLGPHSERDLATDLYSSSTLIVIKTSAIVGSVSDNLKKATTSL
jgi:hypothetical protein